MIDENLIQKLKNVLEKEREKIEEELKKFAEKEGGSENWQTKFPHSDGSSGGDLLEEMADELEEYENLRALEQRLEARLQSINLALQKIKRGTYGLCEKCGREIEIERLKTLPDAKTCKHCLRR